MFYNKTVEGLHNIKNLETFSFLINMNNEVKTKSQSTVVSDCRSITLFLDGMIYNNDRKQLISGFVSNGVDHVKQLEGSFVIFLIEKSAFYILTDKVNSRKAFYTFKDGTWYISNNIDNLPKHKCQLSIDGIACYLANGVMLNDLTLFHDIRSAKRASIHCFKNKSDSITKYWNYKFSYSSTTLKNEKEEGYQKELEQLLINAIKRRYATVSDKACLALSAGYDSRGILGILHNQLKVTNLLCFSYAQDDNLRKHSDAALSKKLADECGYDHKIIKSYRGDLIAFLKKNAVEGKCLTNFCDELDGWHDLAERNYCSDIFVGDECFGWLDVPLNTNAEILDSVLITGQSGIEWLGNFISEKVFNNFCHSLNKLTDDIIKKTSEISDPHDKKDFLYLDQRLNHVLMPWRENISSQIGFVHNPYLDGDILNFMTKLPPHLRKSKSFFRKTITNLLPDLFSITQATSSGVIADWQNELYKNGKLLIEFVLENDSRLDELISKEEIINMIQRQGSKMLKLRIFSLKALNYLRKKSRMADKVLNIVFGPRVKPNGRTVFPETLLLRLLLIRIYLSPSSSKHGNSI